MIYFILWNIPWCRYTYMSVIFFFVIWQFENEFAHEHLTIVVMYFAIGKKCLVCKNPSKEHYNIDDNFFLEVRLLNKEIKKDLFIFRKNLLEFTISIIKNFSWFLKQFSSRISFRHILMRRIWRTKNFEYALYYHLNWLVRKIKKWEIQRIFLIFYRIFIYL